jgi:hypothetical protein
MLTVESTPAGFRPHFFARHGIFDESRVVYFQVNTSPGLPGLRVGKPEEPK